jgi:hypothetical protein
VFFSALVTLCCYLIALVSVITVSPESLIVHTPPTIAEKREGKEANVQIVVLESVVRGSLRENLSLLHFLESVISHLLLLHLPQVKRWMTFSGRMSALVRWCTVILRGFIVQKEEEDSMIRQQIHPLFLLPLQSPPPHSRHAASRAARIS